MKGLRARRGENMRADKFLKVSRIIKRRTVANEACAAGRVSINGKVAKASQEVGVGDVLEIRFGDKAMKLEIVSVKETVKKEEAPAMYKTII
jgi:ribosomal 50S subunit-recycling heat shock protein